MEGKKETFGPNLTSMMFTYRLGGRAGRENVWLEPVMTYRTNAAGLVLHDWEPNTFPSGRT